MYILGELDKVNNSYRRKVGLENIKNVNEVINKFENIMLFNYSLPEKYLKLGQLKHKYKKIDSVMVDSYSNNFLYKSAKNSYINEVINTYRILKDEAELVDNCSKLSNKMFKDNTIDKIKIQSNKYIKEVSSPIKAIFEKYIIDNELELINDYFDILINFNLDFKNKCYVNTKIQVYNDFSFMDYQESIDSLCTKKHFIDLQYKIFSSCSEMNEMELENIFNKVFDSYELLTKSLDNNLSTDEVRCCGVGFDSNNLLNQYLVEVCGIIRNNCCRRNKLDNKKYLMG